MINIDIISARDSNLLGNYHFLKNIVYVGSNHQSDIYCPNTNLSDIHFFIEILENKLILHVNQKAEAILVNSKRTTHFKNLKVGDIIEVDHIKFKITDFSYHKMISKKEKLNELVASLEQRDPELLEIISLMSKES